MRPELETWRDAAWSIVSRGENDSLDGCHWLLHADRLQYPLFVPMAAPEVRLAADALVRWLNRSGCGESPQPPDTAAKAIRPKRSTKNGDGQEKLIAALTLHHDYDNGSCLNPIPVGNNELARLAQVSPSTASAFFKREFDSHRRYQALCRDKHGLNFGLKRLNGEFPGSYLYGRTPPGEGSRDDED